jgi:hypothetical protein
MLNAPTAAAYCGSTASTFAKLRLYGGGPVFMKLGRRVVYDPADLDRWLAEHRRSSTSECAHVAGDRGKDEAAAPVPRHGQPGKRLGINNPAAPAAEARSGQGSAMARQGRGGMGR